ncbi:MAG: hypothetical protein DMG71_07000 [Acidobacteria bacterium]|nr:MAG: hypothetical protein DMG71_07000 [Acidobacteriota bacterium]
MKHPPPWQTMAIRKRKRLGRYEIVSELGRGAMGVVYKARDPKIDRFVALKTISLFGQAGDEDREYRERFFFEAQAAGRLVHPGIVTIFDVGEEPEHRDPYIVMEFIEGQSLSKLLSGEKKKLPFNTALRLTEELAEALDYAHAQGVVHRDIKPANILVTEDGHAKIADFGIAKLNLAHLTVPGQVLGTPAYMSPEQLEGSQVDGRSDLFSLGVILYSMITGFRPFQGNSATTVCFKVANRDPVPATALDSELPPELDVVISRAMAKDPAQRYQRGMEFAQDVRDLREQRLSITQTSTWVPTATSIGMGTRPTQSTRSSLRTRGSSAGMMPRNGWVAGYPYMARVMDTARRNWPKLAVPAAILTVAVGLVGLLRPTRSGESAPPPAEVAPPSSSAAHSAGPRARLAHVNVGRPVSTTSAAPTAFIKPSRKSGDTRRPRSSDKQFLPKESPTGTSNLKMSIEHHFTDGKVALYVDDKLAYAHALRGASKKRLVLFRGGVQGMDSETVNVPTGEHRLRVHVESAAENFDRSTTILGTFTAGDERTLRISFDKQHKDMLVALQ